MSDEQLPVRRPEEYSGEEMNALLLAGAAVAGSRYDRAAMHLITFTDLPGRGDFARHVTVEVVQDTGGADVTCAFVTEWDQLEPGLGRLTGSARRFVLLAAAFAAGKGQQVDLRDALGDMGTAHAKRIIEAFAIALGVDEYYAITDTPALAELRAGNEAFLSGAVPLGGAST